MALARAALGTRFVDDGRIEIDSNTVERSMRPIALNRKNALFAGLLTKLVNGWPNSRPAELTPWACQAQNTVGRAAA